MSPGNTIVHRIVEHYNKQRREEIVPWNRAMDEYFESLMPNSVSGTAPELDWNDRSCDYRTNARLPEKAPEPWLRRIYNAVRFWKR